MPINKIGYNHTLRTPTALRRLKKSSQVTLAAQAICKARGRTSAFILLDSGTSKGKSLLVRQKVY